MGTSRTSIKLSTWAKENGYSYKGAYRLWKKGNLPFPSSQLKTGTILVHPINNSSNEGKTVIYSRVSSHDQKEDLERQEQRLKLFSSSLGIIVDKSFKEVGSGLNGKRPKLLSILSDPGIHRIIVEHRDRLTRFGFQYIESSLKASGRELIVADNSEGKIDIVKDFIDVVTSMCAKIYGARSARNRANRAIQEASNENC